MNAFPRKIYSGLLAFALLLLLLLVVSLDSVFSPELPERISLTEVQLYEPPPPPPPPAARQETEMEAASMSLSMQQNTLQLEMMELDINLEAGQLGNLGTGMAGIGNSTGMEWGTVSLSELDEQPYVISGDPYPYPEELLEQEVFRFEVHFQIIIDEEGRVFPVRVLQTRYPQLNEELLEYVASFRFSPPTRLGVPVRSQYRWPMVFVAAEEASSEE